MTMKNLLSDDTWTKNPSRALVDRAAGLLDVDTLELVDLLLWVWAYYLPKNREKRIYYEAENRLKDLGISIPPPLRRVETVVGWPKKAVSALANRVRFDGFTAADATVQGEIDRISKQAHFKRKHRQALESELISGCDFVTLSPGRSSEPPVIITTRGAEDCAGVWNERLGRLDVGLAIMDYEDRTGVPCECALYTPTETVHITAYPDEPATVEHIYHSMGQPLMVALAYNPSESKPLGQSRITKAVRSITDCAVREALRTEISAEFFTTPQRYLLGTDGDAFENVSRWEAYIGNIFEVSQSEDGTTPQYGQLSQGSMQPHIDYMRSLAARFSNETNVPLSQLGVVTDNPQSAEALEATNEPLVIEAENLIDDNTDALTTIAQLAVAMGRGKTLDALTDEERDIVPHFKNPAMPSIATQVDAAIKISSVESRFPQTDAFWEMLGFDEAKRRTVRGQISSAQNREALSQLMSTTTTEETETTPLFEA